MIVGIKRGPFYCTREAKTSTTCL